MLRLIDINRLVVNEIKFVVAGPNSPASHYAIVSCVKGWLNQDDKWTHEHDDLTYNKCLEFDYPNSGPDERKAFQKIMEAGIQAQKLGCLYIWVDYCCIAPHEVAESVSRRFRWYEAADACLVYLPDSRVDPISSKRVYDKRNSHCRWFSQSWCAPMILGSSVLNFYDKDWTLIHSLSRSRNSNDKPSLNPFEKEIRKITKITPAALMGTVPLSHISVATKMRWASGPLSYERAEEPAYSLAGVFGVRITPRYGEGGTAAFLRLSEAVITKTSDLSILAWHDEAEFPEGEDCSCSALPSADNWALSYRDVPRMLADSSFTMTEKGVKLMACMYPVRMATGEGYFLCLKDDVRGMGKLIGIHVRQVDQNTFQRVGGVVIEEDACKLRRPVLSRVCIRV
ncbi:hypothetical protein F4808DRAFT_409614 [Astrocystis sublimbata]|nr:hypothetical protein F4808DRAFT_409614 [Astrocystis sublimbata]